MLPARTISSLVLVSLLFAPPLAAQATRDEATARLRTCFFQRDFETAAIEGEKLLSAPSSSPELKAWVLLNMARSGKTDEALALAREMVAALPDDPWAAFALAGTLHYKGGHTDEAIKTAERALKAFPDNPDAIWLRAQTTAADPKRRDEAVQFIDSQRARVKNPAQILATKASTLFVGAGQPRDEAKVKASLAAFEEARAIDPANVNAHYVPAVYLTQLRRFDDAIPLARTAVALSPGSSEVHQALWNALKGSPTLGAEKKQAEIEADIRAFLRAHGNRPVALWAVAGASRDLKLAEPRRIAEEKILSEFNDSREAEWVLTYRWRELESAGAAADKAALRKAFSDFIVRPKHYHTGLLGEAYRELFFLLAESDEDEAVSGDELYRIAQGMVKYENNNPHLTVVRGPIALAERKTHLKEAETMARDGIGVLKKKVESQRSFYDNDGEYESAINSMTAMGHDALGWVLFLQGRVDEAEKELLKSYELDHDNRDNLHHLGRLYESRNDFAKAEEYYVKGLGVQRPGENPAEKALKALYAKRNGSEAGFDAYLSKLRDADRETRKTRILASRLAAPATTPAFNLKSLDGKRVSLDSLRGKIVVINFWGIWCGWCVKEMPDLQKLYEKYKADPDVAVVTIDNDENPDAVPPWMKEKGYTFQVLLDDGYVASKARITSFPTTWFLDRDGRRAFEKVGWSEKLLEEFSWRIEALRASASVASR
jgi:tetratricopeptide (TPR) repeat protein